MLTALFVFLTALLDPCAERMTPAEAAAAIRSEVEALGGSPIYADYLIAVARRESSLRPWVRHKLAKDVNASRRAWRRLRHKHRAAGNPWADDAERWGTFGLFGMNANIHAPRLGPKTDPRELCRPAVSVRAYTLAARAALRKMRARGCVDQPRLGDVHRAVQGGRACPRAGEGLRGPLAYAVVTAEDFGRVP